MTRITVLWRLAGQSKDVECVVYQEPARFLLQVERGEEREVFWTFPATTTREVRILSAGIRSRLVTKGWRLVHADGEEALEASWVA